MISALTSEILSRPFSVDLLEIRTDKKIQISMDVNQKYCQSCHLISRNGFIITKIMSSLICC
jgi:hypothetical protein